MHCWRINSLSKWVSRVYRSYRQNQLWADDTYIVCISTVASTSRNDLHQSVLKIKKIYIIFSSCWACSPLISLVTPDKQTKHILAGSVAKVYTRARSLPRHGWKEKTQRRKQRDVAGNFLLSGWHEGFGRNSLLCLCANYKPLVSFDSKFVLTANSLSPF